jgi:hypothetical protein
MGLAISKTIDHNQKRIVWSISPEGIRFYAYLSFWLLVIIGSWLTLYHSDVDFQNNPLMHMFGYNNICILFDSYPATYVLPSVWVISFLLLVSYIITSWVRVYQKYLLSTVSNLSFILFTICTTIEFTSLCLFTTVFSVTPEESMIFHIAPFTCLILALSFLSIKNFVYYNRSANLSSNEVKLGYIYLAIHLFASIIKMIMQINALAGDPLYPTLSFVSFHQFIDRLWMLTAALIPLYLSLKFRKRVSNLVFITQSGK